MKEGIEGIDYVTCKICGQKFGNLNSHLPYKHNTTTKEYRETFSNAFTVCKASKRKISNKALGRKRTKETIEKQRKSILKTFKERPEIREQISRKVREHNAAHPNFRKEVNAYRIGIPMAEETKRKISKANKGRAKSEETKQKMSISKKKYYKTHVPFNLGKETTQAVKDKISATVKKTYEERPELKQQQSKRSKDWHVINDHPWQGKHHTAETKEKISKANKQYYREHPEALEKMSKRVSKAIQGGKYHPEDYSGWNCKRGQYFSKKNNSEIYYGSSFELSAFKILEQDETVIKYSRPTFVITYLYKGTKHRYHSDILVTYENKQQVLIEVKPQYKLDRKDIAGYVKLQAKLEAGKKYCEENNLTFGVWTEKVLEVKEKTFKVAVQ